MTFGQEVLVAAILILGAVMVAYGLTTKRSDGVKRFAAGGGWILVLGIYFLVLSAIKGSP